MITASGNELDVAQSQLASGERIEWVGRPNPKRYFTRQDAVLIPFSLVWCGFAIFWEAAAIRGGANTFFALWGVPFVAIGLYLVFGRFIFRAYRTKRTVYAVTNRRVMTIVRGRRGEAVNAMYVRSIPNVSTNIGSDGRGSVEFGVSAPAAARYASSGLDFGGSQAGTGVGFYDVDGARDVADLVERLRQADQS